MPGPSEHSNAISNVCVCVCSLSLQTVPTLCKVKRGTLLKRSSNDDNSQLVAINENYANGTTLSIDTKLTTWRIDLKNSRTSTKV